MNTSVGEVYHKNHNQIYKNSPFQNIPVRLVYVKKKAKKSTCFPPKGAEGGGHSLGDMSPKIFLGHRKKGSGHACKVHNSPIKIRPNKYILHHFTTKYI